MKSKKRIAFYPVFADTLPIIRYYQRYCSDIEVVELLSPRGSCACGKDAGFLDNREHYGMYIQAPDEANPEKWEELYLLRHDVLGIEALKAKHDIYDPMISSAISSGKSIRIEPENETAHYIKKLDRKKHGIINSIKKYVVFIGGVIGEANSLEVFLRVYGELRKHLSVVAFSSANNVGFCDVISLRGILYNREYLGFEKIIAINNLILDKIKERDADLVLIHVEEAMMSFSNSMTNGFGIVPYMISQIVSPDFSICCLPYDYANPEFTKEFSQGIDGRFCFSPDVWHVSNVLLDTTVALEVQDFNTIYAPIESVFSMQITMDSNDPQIGSLIDDVNLENCTNKILEDWRESKRVESLN